MIFVVDNFCHPQRSNLAMVNLVQSLSFPVPGSISVNERNRLQQISYNRQITIKANT